LTRQQDEVLPSIFLQRLKDGTEETDYMVTLFGAYEAANYIDVWSKEAGVKGCVLLLSAMLIPSEEWYGGNDQEPEKETESDGPNS